MTELQGDWTPAPVGEGWEFTHPQGPVLVVDHLNPSRGSLHAWVELRWQNGTSTRLLSAATRNLMGPTTPASLTKDAVATLGRTREAPSPEWWQRTITDALYFVVTRHREGRPTVDLFDTGTEGFRWTLRPLLEAGGHTRLIAAGGAGKSFLVLAIALAIATGTEGPFGTVPTDTGPVVYLDWETHDHGKTHGYRLRAVARGMGIDLEPGLIVHQQHDLPLAERASAVSKLVDKLESPLVIVDSNTMARGSGGRAGPEAATTDLLQALRIIGRPALLLDHKSKEDIQKNRRGGYGSIHNQNQVRLEWEYTRVYPQGGDTTRVLLENTKQNNVPPQDPIGLEVAFDNDYSDPDRPQLMAVTFDKIPAALVRGVHPGAGDSAHAPAEQMVRWLAQRTEPATAKEISDALGIHRATVSKICNDDSRLLEVGKAGRSKLWGLHAGAEPLPLHTEQSAVTGERQDEEVW